MSKKDKKSNNKKHIIIRIPEGGRPAPDGIKMMDIHRQLREGDSIEVASTGTTLCKLKGADVHCAKNANMGGGAKRIRRSGMVKRGRRLQKYNFIVEKCVERHITVKKAGSAIVTPAPNSGTIPSKKAGRVVANPDPNGGTIPPVEK